MSQDNQNRPSATPISNDAPKSPADRMRQIQEMQRAAEAQQATPARTQQAAQSQQTKHASASQATVVPDGFNVQQANRVAQTVLTPKPNPAEHAAMAQTQKSAQALFGGGSTDLEIKGNPWKVIPFGDTLPALFDPPQPLENYEAMVPEKAVQTEQGLLFEMGLKARKGDEPVSKRAVLVDGQGRLSGAECKTGSDVERLFKNAPWLLPAAATQGNTKWSVSQGQDSAFALRLDRPSGRGTTTELQPLNNFGLPLVSGKGGRDADVVVANYFLDRFDAGL